MTTSMRPTAVSTLALAVVLGLAGCASSGKQQQEAEHQARLATSHLNLGADHMQQGRAALALREFRTAASYDPLDPRIQSALGEAYLFQGKQEEAEQHFLRALEVHPEHHDARLNLSALYILQGRYEEAIAACQTLLDDPTFPGPWRALANRGWAEYRLGRAVQARESLELAREYASNYYPAMLSLAVLEAEEGHRLEAIGLLQEVIELEPGPSAESEANYRLAENYIALGKRKRAVGYLTAAVARAPEGEWAKRSEEYLKLLR